MAAWARHAEGIDIAVRVTPRGGRDLIAAGGDAHFNARLSAAPVDGAANAALIALVAARFGVARRDVHLIAGARARVKRLRIAGDAEALAQRAATL